MNDEKQREIINEILNNIAIEKGVRLLYACAGGSREWGFASEHSDYDVYFLYVHPKNAYLRLDSPQDTIERKINTEDMKLGINGWDIFKALRLLRKSNPPLLEQLFSTTIYIENTPQIDILRDIARRTYSSSAVFYHYSRMAFRNYRQYIANKIASGENEVPLKKYLYVVRPMIALFYIDQHKTLPPANFLETLRNIELDNEVRKAILDLIGRKQAGQKLDMGPPIPVLNAFAEQYLHQWLENDPEKDNKRHDFKVIDEIVLSILEEDDTNHKETKEDSEEAKPNIDQRSELSGTAFNNEYYGNFIEEEVDRDVIEYMMKHYRNKYKEKQ